MDELLTAVKTSRLDSSNDGADSTTSPSRRATSEEADREHPRITDSDEQPVGVTIPARTLDGILQILRNEPNEHTLLGVLRSVTPVSTVDEISLQPAGPMQAQIVSALVETIVPTFWASLNVQGKALLANCFLNLAGLNAVISKLKLLTTQTKNTKKSDDEAARIGDLLQVLSTTLQDVDCIRKIWTGLQKALQNGTKKDLIWKEVTTLFGSGKIVSVFAEACDVSRSSSGMPTNWLASGEKYARWIARNICDMLLQPSLASEPGMIPAVTQLLSRSLGMGYPVVIVRTLLEALIGQAVKEQDDAAQAIHLLMSQVPPQTVRRVLEVTLKWLSIDLDIDASARDIGSTTREATISGIARLLCVLCQDSSSGRRHLIAILMDPALACLYTNSVCRACSATVSSLAPNELQALLEKTVAMFGDPLFITHAPILQQEYLAKILLLTSGYLHRFRPSAVMLAARSSRHMQGVSNRLEATNPRARWLGMIVGTAISRLNDSHGSNLNFGTEDMQTDEAQSYLTLIHTQDEVGSLEDLSNALQIAKQTVKRPRKSQANPRKEKLPIINGKQAFGPPRPPAMVQTEIIGDRFTELSDGEMDEDADLIPYAKPDSDPEDSDEDATLVNRNRPRPPVYVRTLMAMLRETENVERFQLALRHAAPLIRRKTNFGREVADHAEELARIFTNLQDPFDTADFDELRLQALIAVLLSNVSSIGPWLSRQAFIGEFSIAQRSIMLTAIGLGGRELAGFKDEDELNPNLSYTNFPTKRLPTRLHSIYSPAESTSRRLHAASTRIENSLIQPMALAAADHSTAHLNAVKVRTFSSRMEVERSKRKAKANELAKVLGDAFFFPLIGRYQQDVAAYGSSSIFASTHFLLTTFLKTLAILLHASGPATAGLPQLTSEFWDLLLSLRVKATSDITVMEALLFALLTLLDVNTDKQRIAQEHAKQLMETKEWVDMVFERTGGGQLVEEGKGEEARVRTLSAGVLMKTGEVIEGYQKQLMGKWTDF